MTALTILIPLSLGMGVVGLCAFLWALRTNQFDDPEGNAWRVITQDDEAEAAYFLDKGNADDDYSASEAANRNPVDRR